MTCSGRCGRAAASVHEGICASLTSCALVRLLSSHFFPYTCCVMGMGGRKQAFERLVAERQTFLRRPPRPARAIAIFALAVVRVRELAGCAKSPTVRPAPLGRSRHPRRVYPPPPAPFWPLPALVLVGPSSVSSVGPFVLRVLGRHSGLVSFCLWIWLWGFVLHLGGGDLCSSDIRHQLSRSKW